MSLAYRCFVPRYRHGQRRAAHAPPLPGPNAHDAALPVAVSPHAIATASGDSPTHHLCPLLTHPTLCWSHCFAQGPCHRHGQRRSAHRRPTHHVCPVQTHATLLRSSLIPRWRPTLQRLLPRRSSCQCRNHTRYAPLATDAALCISGLAVGLPPYPRMHARTRGVPSAILRRLAHHLRFHGIPLTFCSCFQSTKRSS